VSEVKLSFVGFGKPKNSHTRHQGKRERERRLRQEARAAKKALLTIIKFQEEGN
jgi:hypothetical protein